MAQRDQPWFTGEILKDREFEQSSAEASPNQNSDDRQGCEENGREPLEDG